MKGSVFVQQINGLTRIPDRENAVEKAVKEGHSVAWPLVEVAVDVGESVLALRVAALPVRRTRVEPRGGGPGRAVPGRRAVARRQLCQLGP